MVFSVLIAMCVSDLFEPFHTVLAFVTIVVILRELAVTSMRLLAATSSDNVVVAAAWSGKVKTVSQILFLLSMMLEPCIANFLGVANYHIVSWVTMIFMTFMTIYSGLEYFSAYRKYISMD